MVMVSNNCGNDVGHLATKHPGLLGHLYSPGGQRGPWEYLPYALDNGAFALWNRNLDWKESPWLRLLEWAASAKQRPLWAVVPDVITDRERTLERWHVYAPRVAEFGIRPAFAIQDAMTFDDVPDAECMLFLGGSTGWKMAAIQPWCARFPGRVHVARVTEHKRLMLCYESGAVSVDGNGWFRTTNKPGQRIQFDDLKRYLELASNREGRKAA